jgi:hypothetical protein
MASKLNGQLSLRAVGGVGPSGGLERLAKTGFRRNAMETKEYRPPKLVSYGPIADHTFATPGGNVKGCISNCHQDNFNEPSGLS